jgi:poly(A) polymerase Pap1
MNKQKQKQGTFAPAVSEISSNKYNQRFLKKFNKELRLSKEIRDILKIINKKMPTINYIFNGVREGLTAVGLGAVDDGDDTGCC